MTLRQHVLVVDDEELIRWSLGEHLQQAGYRTSEAEDGEAALAALKDDPPDAMLLDLKMPKLGGLGVLAKLRELEVDFPVIVLTAYGGLDSAIEATRLGATAYLTKPFDLREVELSLQKAIDEAKLRREVRFLRAQRRGGFGSFVGQAATLTPLFEMIDKLGRVDAPTVLITGESGTGKDVLARVLHERGSRANQPFLEIDCASLPESLIESELFGHERGAFTDARATKRGLFEVAGGGVAFLDEIGELPLTTQSKLLRALENRTFRRVGGTQTQRMDAAIVAATNRDLQKMVAEGEFREDLYFRLDVVRLHIPPLRDRREDIPALVSHFLERFHKQFGRRVEGVSGEAMARLEAWRWPGNVRELRNVLERACILCDQDVITPADLPAELRFGRADAVGEGGCPFVLPEDGVDLALVEQGLIEQAMARTEGNQSAAARLLGISRYALRHRLKNLPDDE